MKGFCWIFRYSLSRPRPRAWCCRSWVSVTRAPPGRCWTQLKSFPGIWVRAEETKTFWMRNWSEAAQWDVKLFRAPSNSELKLFPCIKESKNLSSFWIDTKSSRWKSCLNTSLQSGFCVCNVRNFGTIFITLYIHTPAILEVCSFHQTFPVTVTPRRNRS